MLFNHWSELFLSKIFGEDIGKFGSHLERVDWIHGATDGKVELVLDAETFTMAEQQETIEHYRKLMKEAYGESLFHLFTSYLVKERLSEFEKILKSRFFETIQFSEVYPIIPTVLLGPQIKAFSISPEVREMMETNELHRTILDSVLLEIQETLELRDENYYINVSFEQDIEVPEWKEILISVKVEDMDFIEKMNLWETMEQQVRTEIEDIRNHCISDNQKRIIDEINQGLAIEVIERTS